jgi:hypothetical protein
MITTTYTYRRYSSWGLTLVCDMLSILRTVKGTVPWPSSRDDASWVSFKLSPPNSSSWKRLSAPTHSSLWLLDLGADLVTDRLGQVEESADLASRAHHLLQVDNSIAHYSSRVRCPPILLRGHFMLDLFPS